MKRVQNAANQEKTLNELYRRYDQRGMTYDRSPAYTEQKSLEMNVRATAPKSYKLSAGDANNLKKYKNGVAGQRRYMTDKDFASYYRASREYTPDSNVELDTTILLQKIDRARYKKDKAHMKNEKIDIKKRLKAEADRNNPKRGLKEQDKKVEYQTNKQKINSLQIKKVAREAAKTWIPLEERENEKIVQGGTTKLPIGVIIAILVITVSLLMIISATVLLASAQREQNDLKNGIDDLEFEISELETDLNKKNENIDIEYFAEEVLGMINQEHVNTEYINSNKTDGVVKQEAQKASIASLLDWIFQLFE